ncbi:MAG: class I SAM-dependent methyltransferase [Sulfuritalea sp.]|nr:class I SAM-dependent methyltransferase [Sulfuritalea sp.]
MDALVSREGRRERLFSRYWKNGLDPVFTDVAGYYDRANQVASLGLWNWFLRHHMDLVETRPNMRSLDICAGTNAAGIALLRKESTLEAYALDRNVAMQTVGRRRARDRGMQIRASIGDAHQLPYPDNHFDIVTLQWAARHLRLGEVFDEVCRVLKPGGHFHHCDMLRPPHPVVAKLYFGYLRFCLTYTAGLFRSGEPVLNCRSYFIDAIDNFYSPAEFSALLCEHGLVNVVHKSLLAGMIGVHRAQKPAQRSCAERDCSPI